MSDKQKMILTIVTLAILAAASLFMTASRHNRDGVWERHMKVLNSNEQSVKDTPKPVGEGGYGHVLTKEHADSISYPNNTPKP